MVGSVVVVEGAVLDGIVEAKVAKVGSEDVKLGVVEVGEVVKVGEAVEVCEAVEVVKVEEEEDAAIVDLSSGARS